MALLFYERCGIVVRIASGVAIAVPRYLLSLRNACCEEARCMWRGYAERQKEGW